MTAATDKATRRARHWTMLPWAVLAIGIPASLLLFTVIGDAVENVARLRFERQASDAKAVIEHRINFYADFLYGLKALFASQDPVNRLQFHRFVESLDLKHRFPGFDVVNYSVYVPAKDKERFMESVRRDTSLDPRGYPRFAIKPSGERAEYYVLAYVEPMAGFEFAFGRDLGANPDAADPQPLVVALHSARDSGKLTASGVPLRIKTGSKDYIGLAMRLAVYRSGMLVDTVQERRTAYLGSVGAGFNVEDLMRGVLDENTMQYIRLKLYDVRSAIDHPGLAADGERWLLFDSNQLTQASSAGSATDEPGSVFAHVLPMEVGGRIWEVRFSARKDAIIDRVDVILSWTMLAGGLLTSVLLSGMFYSLASSRSRAVEIANEITRDLRASTEQLQALSRRLVDIQETDRRQFSRELHDRIGQNLTALSINLDILKTQISNDESAEFRSRLDDSAALLESTAGAVENVMSELRPPMLDDYGLLPALQWYGNQFSSRTGICVAVHGEERAERLPPATEIALFRIAQEALNNIAKHAHAKLVDVRLERLSTRCIMSVADDGVGFDAASNSNSGRRVGFGMVTMRERTQAVGGQFEVGAAPGGGTRIVVLIPC